jgi:subtilisin family serine protease
MPAWSDGNGGGPVHEALAALLGPANAKTSMLFFACAGNTAQRHWTGQFCADARGRHQWIKGHVSNRLVPWGTESVTVELYGNLNENYTLHVLEDETGRVVGQDSTRDEDAFGPALVRFRPRPTESYRVMVTRQGEAKQPAESFHLVVLGGTLEHAVPVASIPFPGDGARVVTVGAVDREGNRVAYSSCGAHTGVRKPDLVAPVPFPSRCRQIPFAGTSAAAPQAAGLAALLWSRYPTSTAEQVLRQLHEAARDLGPKGHDLETGHGQVRLPAPR